MNMNNLKKYLMFFFAACVALTACVKEEMNLEEAGELVSFKATYADPVSKTVLGDHVPMWTPEDSISVYDGSNNVFSNNLTENATSAVFKGKLEGQGLDRKSFIAAYPYNEAYTFSFVGSFVGGMQVSAEQAAVEGGYDPKSAPAVAFADSTKLAFNNAFSLVKFSVDSDSVTEVTLTGNGNEDIAGRMNVAKGEPLRFTVTKAESKITLKGNFKKGTKYYITTIPATLNKGFTVSLKTSDGKIVESLKYSKKVEFVRSAILNVGELSLTPSTDQTPDDTENGDENEDENGDQNEDENDDENGEEEGDENGEENGDQNGGNDNEVVTGTIYLHPSTGWKSDGARFAAYFFGNGEAWVDMTDADGDGNYECQMPAGGYTGVIFIRMNPEFTDNNWSNETENRVWNKTPDLDVPSGNAVCYVVNPDKWNPEDSDFGYWTTYPPVVDEGGSDNGGSTTDTPVTFEGKIYLRPSASWHSDGARFAAYFFGNSEVWVDLTDADGDGNYECGVPSGATNVIFVRMNPASAENNWDNKWNQSPDLDLPTGDSICYVINPDKWVPEDSDFGYWTTFPPVVDDSNNGGNTDDNTGGNTDGSSAMIYLDPWQWVSDGARIEAYFFGGTGEAWETMTVNNGLYECAVPEGQTKVIFVRMDPTKPEHNWDSKWNQTSDLDIPTNGQNKFTINSWDGDNGKSAGTWSTK